MSPSQCHAHSLFLGAVLSQWSVVVELCGSTGMLVVEGVEKSRILYVITQGPRAFHWSVALPVDQILHFRVHAIPGK